MRIFSMVYCGLFLAVAAPAFAETSSGEVLVDNILPCAAVGQRIVFSGDAVQTDMPISVGMTLTFIDSMNSALRFQGVVAGSVRANNHATGRWTAELTEATQ
jgi:hypothetical protein